MVKMISKSKRKIFTVVAAMTVLSTVLSACEDTKTDEEYLINEEDKLIIYTAHKEEIYKPIVKEFEERTGIWVELEAGGTNEMLEKIADEKGTESCDIMFGGGVDSLSAFEDCFEPYVTSQSENLDDIYSSDTNAYTVFSKLPIVFVYNTKLVLTAGAPRTWQQLLEYPWKGSIAFADPLKSGSSFTALCTMIQQLEKSGMQREDIIDGFVNNLGGDLSDGSNTVVEDVALGDKMIGVTLEENALKLIDRGADIDMIYPVDGTCAVPDGAAIVKGCRHRENAEKFMEFIVGDDVQHLLEEQLYRRSVRTDFDSSDLPYEAQYGFEYAMENRNEIIAIWEQSL